MQASQGRRRAIRDIPSSSRIKDRSNLRTKYYLPYDWSTISSQKRGGGRS